ncbi:MAG: tetratricopeptide repeat protein [Gemmataceae bacterium]
MIARKWIPCLVSSGCLAFVGCQTTEKTPNQKMAEQLAAAQQPPSMWQRMTGQAPAVTTPIANPKDEFAKPLSKPGTPLKLETECEFAETTFASAIDPSMVGPDRDRRLDSARQQFQHVLNRDPKYSRAMIGLAKVYAETGDRQKAGEYLKMYFEVNPKDHKTAFDVAMIYGKKKDFEAASAGCEFALSLDTENREYRKALGFFLALTGKVDQAVVVLTANRTMTEAQARHNIAGILAEMQQFDACKQQLRVALQVDPLYEPAKAMLSEIEHANGVVQTDYQPR